MKKQSILSKLLLMVVVYSLTFMPATNLLAQTDQAVTQGDFAKYLVRALGLEHNLPVGANIKAYVDILEQLHMVPPGGYDPTKPLTKKDMAFIMVRVSGLENKVINRMTGQSLVKKSTAFIKEIEGDVQYKREERSEYGKAEIGDELYAENSIKTGEGSWVVLQIGRYGAARIAESTEITIEELAIKGAEQKDSVRMYLKKGEVLVNVKAEGKPVLFETRTNTTVAGVMGSSYLHSTSETGDTVNCFEGPISTYLLDAAGAPLGEPKALNAREQLFVNPNTPDKPEYRNFEPDTFKNAKDQIKNLATIIPPPVVPAQGEQGQPFPTQGSEQDEKSGKLSDTAPNAQTGDLTPEDELSSFKARQELSEGTQLALNAALETLAEEGMPIEPTGAATAASEPITLVQLTQFIEDLILLPRYYDFNVDATPIGQ